MAILNTIRSPILREYGLGIHYNFKPGALITRATTPNFSFTYSLWAKSGLLLQVSYLQRGGRERTIEWCIPLYVVENWPQPRKVGDKCTLISSRRFPYHCFSKRRQAQHSCTSSINMYSFMLFFADLLLRAEIDYRQKSSSTYCITGIIERCNCLLII